MMSLEEFFERFHLHDSGVEGAEQRPAEGVFRLRVELCNYDQPGYREGEPELLLGWLEFRGVTEFSAVPSLPSILWGPTLDGEILAAEITGPATDNQGPQAKVVISLMNYQTKAKDILVINFRASSVKWTPAKPLAKSP